MRQGARVGRKARKEKGGRKRDWRLNKEKSSPSPLNRRRKIMGKVGFILGVYGKRQAGGF